MTWVFNKSTPVSGSVAMYNFINCLETAGWTQVTAGNSGSYYTSAPFITSGGPIANGLGNNYSWTRIRSPSGVQEFTIQRITANTTWRLKYSMAAGFVGGSPNGSTTPSATDQVVMLGGGTDAAPTGIALFTTDNTYRFNAAADNASPYGFYMFAFNTGGDTVSRGTWVYEPLTATHPSDAHVNLNMIYISGYTLTPGTSGITSRTLTANQNMNLGTVPAASPAASFVQYAGLYYFDFTGQIVPSNMAVNPISSADEVIPIIYARASAIVSPGYKGIGTVVKWAGTTRVIGDTLSVNSTKDRIFISTAATVPWDGSTPTV